jgi:hypothetical protein
MLRLVVNGVVVLDYQPQARLPGHVRDFLARMDADMDDGFSLAGQVVEQPDDMQRVQFVAVQLFQSFMREKERLRAASCAWLCHRMPELREVKVDDSEEEISLELVMDKK